MVSFYSDLIGSFHQMWEFESYLGSHCSNKFSINPTYLTHEYGIQSFVVFSRTEMLLEI